LATVLKNSFFYSIGNITTKATSFFLLPLYTSFLTPSQYGVVTSMNVFSSLLLVFFTLGLERSIYRLFFDYKSETEKRTFLGTMAISIFVIGFFFVVLLFLLHDIIKNLYESIEFNPYFIYAILTTFFASFELIPQISFQVKDRAKVYLLVSLLLTITRVIPVLLFVVYFQEGAVGMLKGAMIGNIVSLVYLVPLTLKQINFRFELGIFFTSLRYCLPLVPTIASAWVMNLSDRIFIERYFSTVEVGIYSLGYKIGQIVQLISGSFLMAYNPYFFKLANSDDQLIAKKNLYKLNNAGIVILLFIGFLVAFFSKDIVFFFFKPEYYVSFKIIPIIVFGYFFVQLISIQSLSFYQKKKTLINMNISIFGAMLNIGLNFLLIREFNYYGAALATVVTQFILFLVLYHYSKRYYFIPYNWKLLIPLLSVFVFIVTIANLFWVSNFFYFVVKIIIALSVIFFLLRKVLPIFKRHKKNKYDKSESCFY
jgi:O-antigen/teichoic acid export membrane protein